MASALPYVFSTSGVTKVLEKIKAAAVPDKFTQSFLADTLGMKGGTASLLIPYLKKIGFLNGDGTPTDIYKRFRNPSASKGAVAEAMKIGYAPLFSMNESAHKLSDPELRGLIVQATGMESDSSPVGAMVGCFKILKGLADFSATTPDVPEPKAIVRTDPLPAPPAGPSPTSGGGDGAVGLNLSYTINLQLPATADVNVFNAIFRSLKENLLKR